MPVYVYRFVDSGETIEVQQSFSDAALTEAVHPGSGELKPVKKVFTPVGVTFKGGGFYKTDSRGKSGSGSSSGSAGTAGSSNGSSGSEASGSSASSTDSASTAPSSGSSAPSTPSSGGDSKPSRGPSHSHGTHTHTH